MCLSSFRLGVINLIALQHAAWKGLTETSKSVGSRRAEIQKSRVSVKTKTPNQTSKLPKPKMAKTKTGVCAVILSVASFFFILTAFCSGYWLVNDGQIHDPKFIRIGLWEVCFENFEDFRHQYDNKFTGCWWVFEEEYYIIHDFLLPPFFIATQFFFTLCMTLVLVAVALTWLYCFCSRDHDKYLILLMSNALNHWIAGFCGFIAVITFGLNGDRRDWMPYWQHNDLGWSYAFAVVGSLLLWPAGALFLTEGRRARYKQLDRSRPASQYSMEAPKPSHTDI